MYKYVALYKNKKFPVFALNKEIALEKALQHYRLSEDRESLIRIVKEDSLNEQEKEQ